jgi:hypothetical protein
MHPVRAFLLATLLWATSLACYGQISVDLQIKRRTFLRHEPVVASVSITNLSGRDLTLKDTDSQWFGFQISRGDANNLVPPLNPDYHLDALDIKAGETVKRTLNLNSLFYLGEYGTYRIKAMIYAAELGKYFVSKPGGIEISEGMVMWQQTVGVPEGQPNAGSNHTVSVIKFDAMERPHYYVRIEDKQAGSVFCAHKLGVAFDGQPPQMQLDFSNSLYVLQTAGPRHYVLSKISINGELESQTEYDAPKARPYLRRLADGRLQIVGAVRSSIAAATREETPKLSERPPGLPQK